MANQFLDELIQQMQGDPEIRAFYGLAYPRRIVPPQGYMNPRYYAPTTASSCWTAKNHTGREADFVTSCIFFISRKLVKLRVPTFFVGQEFAEAVAETRIESDICSSEIDWPDEAMLFVLPDKFSKEFFGYHIPFLALANYSTEEVRSLPGVRIAQPDGSPAGPNAKNIIDGQVFMDFQWHQNNTEPGIDYISSWPMHESLAHVAEALMKTKLNVLPEEKVALELGLLDKVGMDDENVERALISKMREFSAKLLLAMTAEPKFVERGTKQRKVRVRRGVVREALWSPNTIGFKYRHPHGEGDGTHASPRLHRRCGHFRDQHYGEKNAMVKRLWIKPTWVGAKTETNAQKVAS